MKIFYLLLASPFLLFSQKKEIISYIEKNQNEYKVVAQNIWSHAEVGFQETKSAKELISLLKEEGFEITEGVAGMPTAFVAEYKNGGPVIGVLGEYDALPGLSQTNEAEKKEREGVFSGHACGHNLFGVASAAAVIGVKKWLVSNNKKGTLRFYGCPAEEGGSGKVYLVREGLFKIGRAHV